MQLSVFAVWSHLFAVALVASSNGLAAAREPTSLRQELEQLVRDLDADQFAVRKVAAFELEQLASRADPKGLAEEIHRMLLQPKLSFEARTRLERLARSLPEATHPNGTASVAQIEELIGQLQSECYAERLGASRRLEWLLKTPELVCPIMVRLKERLVQGELSPDARLWIEPLDQSARLAWLTGDPKDCQLSAVSDPQIAAWIDALARPASEGDQTQWSVLGTARRELLDVLARDSYVPRIVQALETKLAEPNLDPAGEKRLRELLELAPPGMVAEFWTDRQHVGTQYLVVGVPSLGPGAARPSHFDRIDDEVAHCVSGNSLLPGDYPVGVAIPHPKQENAIFHLVNLPTPRRRMAYEFHRQTDATGRLAAITRRTAEQLLEQKRHLTEAELVTLPQLDVNLASAFAAKMLTAIEDKRLPEDGPQRTAGRPSHHGMLCVFLAAEGTKSAMPMLLEAIQASRVLPPTEPAPYRLDWLAALSIALADPWLEAETWLAGLIDRTDRLIAHRDDSPELGATAAAILVQKHEQALLAFGLEPTPDRTLDIFGVPGCRFTTPEARQDVHRWWSKHETAAKLRPEARP